MDQNNEQPKQPKSDDSTQPQLHIEIKEGAFEGNQGQVNIGSKVKNIYNHVHKKVKKNPKLSLIVGGCLVVLLILLIISTASSSEAEAAKAIDKFENAIVMEDIETIKDMISVDTAEMGIKDEYLKQLCDYAKKILII
ncbi:hypothetical protein ACFO25_01670 [Paenactinomyces guangxiensis]|uniref:Uncharacterized protein n=1 Tax=Paenactinomyces guangxiensis TaxID=1490290 RepID=A0A7W1WS34_9BACL|nr:hypothetical protein [Paenactinomyces guangxiensis]MBA4494938.1 hypothetical protein [Paenactinomyces guangxiensis]MBH8592021.1 hypothetical protein [Paenactinomyces guangxiensis]